MSDKTDEIVDELFEPFSQNYKKYFDKSMIQIEFIFDSVDLLYYILQKTNLNKKGSSYIDSPEWLKNKKAKINPKTNDNNYIQYVLIATLNYQNIKSHPECV